MYYIKIGAFECVNYTRGQGYLESNKKNKILKSKECKACKFHFLFKVNFQYNENICNGCHGCLNYEKINYNTRFQVVKTEKGIFRAVCHYVLEDINKILNEKVTVDLGGWSVTINVYNRPPCGIEPQSLKLND